MSGRRGLRRGFFLSALATAGIPLAVFGGVVFVLAGYAEDEEPGEDPAAEVAEAGELVAQALLLAAPAGVIVALVSAAVLSRRTVRPIDQAIEAARRTSAHDLSRRLDVPDTDDELRDLVVAQNALFARLDDGFGALARFAADASHELRTPLAVMAAELEVAIRQPPADVDWSALATSTLHDTRRLTAVVEGLLSLARAGADAPGARRPTAVLELVDGVIAQLGAAAEARGLTLIGPPGDTDATVDANPATLDTAVRNLVDNAIRHARGRIEVGLVRTAGGRAIEIHVDDDGAGFGDPPEQLFAPLVRGSAADRGAGAGLGLAIARRIAEAHGGGLSAGPAPSGGARVTITLPIAT